MDTEYPIVMKCWRYSTKVSTFLHHFGYMNTFGWKIMSITVITSTLCIKFGFILWCTWGVDISEILKLVTSNGYQLCVRLHHVPVKFIQIELSCEHKQEDFHKFWCTQKVFSFSPYLLNRIYVRECWYGNCGEAKISSELLSAT